MRYFFQLLMVFACLGGIFLAANAQEFTATQGSSAEEVLLRWDEVPGATAYKIYALPDSNFTGANIIATCTPDQLWIHDDPTTRGGFTVMHYWLVTETGSDSTISGPVLGYLAQAGYGAYLPTGISWQSVIVDSTPTTGNVSVNLPAAPANTVSMALRVTLREPLSTANIDVMDHTAFSISIHDTLSGTGNPDTRAVFIDNVILNLGDDGSQLAYRTEDAYDFKDLDFGGAMTLYFNFPTENTVESVDVQYFTDPKCSEVIGLSATLNGSSVDIDYTGAFDAEGYRIYRSSTPDFFTADSIAEVGASTYAYTDNTPPPGSVFYWVTGVDIDGVSGSSGIVASVLPPLPVPGALTLAFNVNGTVTASWTYTAANHIRLWRCTEGDVDSTPVSDWMSIATSFYDDYTVAINTDYSYWLEAAYVIDADTVFGLSASISTGVFPPRHVVTLKGFDQVIVTWDTVAVNAQYQVFRDNEAITGWIDYNSISDNVLRDLDNHYYSVAVSFNAGVDSVMSTSVLGHLNPFPKAVIDTICALDNPVQVNMGWDLEESAGVAFSHRLWRSLDGADSAPLPIGWQPSDGFDYDSTVDIWGEYTYWIETAFAAGYPSVMSEPTSVWTATPPPSNVQASQGDDFNILISWDLLLPGMEYRVLRRVAGTDDPYLPILSSSTWFKDISWTTDRPGDTRAYEYVVQARKGSVVSEYSASAKGWVGDPERPRLRYVSQSEYYTKIRVEWIAPAGNGRYTYTLERREDGLDGFVGKGKKKSVTFKTTDTFYTDVDLEPGKSYFYRVSAKVNGKTGVSEADEGRTKRAGVTVIPGTVETIFTVSVDSVAFDPEPTLPSLPIFEKRPAVTGRYIDIFKSNTTKKFKFKILSKAKDYPSRTAEVSDPKPLLLYSKKALAQRNKTGMTTVEYFNDLPQLPDSVEVFCNFQVTDSDGKKLNLKNRRLLVDMEIRPPQVDTVNGEAWSSSSRLRIGALNEVRMQGAYFGTKLKAWFEPSNGKPNKKVPKVKMTLSYPTYLNDKGKPSASDLRTGATDLTLQFPNDKKAKEAFNYGSGHFVIQTREGYGFIPVTFVSTP